MTMHKSLRSRGMMAGQRSVLSRWERIEKLKAGGRWHDGDKVVGLPKVRTKFKVRRKTAPAAAGAAAATPAAGGAAAPAAGAKAAAPAAKAAAPAAAAAKPAKK
jgi:small basic protein (TIGR04137 family)